MSPKLRPIDITYPATSTSTDRRPTKLDRPTDDQIRTVLNSIPALYTGMTNAPSACSHLASYFGCSSTTTRYWLDHYLSRPGSVHLQVFVSHGTLSSILRPHPGVTPERHSHDWYRRAFLGDLYPYLLTHHLPIAINANGEFIHSDTTAHTRPNKRYNTWIVQRSLLNLVIAERITEHQQHTETLRAAARARREQIEADYAPTIGRARSMLHQLGVHPAAIDSDLRIHRPEPGTDFPDVLMLNITGTQAIHAFGQILFNAGFPVITHDGASPGWTSEYTIELPLTAKGLPLRSSNDRLYRIAAGKLNKILRQRCRYRAETLDIPPAAYLVVQLHYTPPTNARRDAPNLVASSKPAIDGLVDAKIITDDNPTYLREIMPVIHRREPGQEPRMWLTIWHYPARPATESALSALDHA